MICWGLDAFQASFAGWVWFSIMNSSCSCTHTVLWLWNTECKAFPCDGVSLHCGVSAFTLDTMHPILKIWSLSNVSWFKSPSTKINTVSKTYSFLTFRQNAPTHSLGPCWRGVRSHLLTDEATLRHSYISADQSQSPGVLHQLSDWYLGLIPSPLCSPFVRADTELWEGTRRLLYATVNSSQWEIECSWQLFSVIKQYGFHVCSLWCFQSRRRLTCIQWIRFSFWHVVWAIPAVTK